MQVIFYYISSLSLSAYYLSIILIIILLNLYAFVILCNMCNHPNRQIKSHFTVHIHTKARIKIYTQFWMGK